MIDDAGGHGGPTRREDVKRGGAVIGGGLLAGCAGDTEISSTPDEPQTSGDETATGTVDSLDSARVEPVGAVTFYWMLPDVDVPDSTGGGLRGQERALNKEYVYEVDLIGIDPNWPDGEYQYYALQKPTEDWGRVFDEPERAGAKRDASDTRAVAHSDGGGE